MRKALGAPPGTDVSLLKRDEQPPGGRQWDSLNHMILCSLLEEEFDVLLSIEQIGGLGSVADAERILFGELEVMDP